MVSVFVVDDDNSAARFLARALKLEGFDTAIFGSGEDFLMALETRMPSVVLLDHDLPGRNGLQVLETLQLTGVMPKVVMITGREELGLRDAVLRAGATGFAVKPIDLDALFSLVDTALKA
jgi:two-component system, NtrC family, response regulator AtoC